VEAQHISGEGASAGSQTPESGLADHLSRAAACIDEASGALEWVDTLLTAEVTAVNQDVPATVGLCEWMAYVARQPFVAIAVSKKGLRIDSHIPDGARVGAHVALKSCVAELLCNAVKHAVSHTSVTVGTEEHSLIISNKCTLQPTEDWQDLSLLAKDDCMGVGTLLAGARLLQLMPPRYRVDPDGHMHVVFQLSDSRNTGDEC
jgi:hypothetical protein